MSADVPLDEVLAKVIEAISNQSTDKSKDAKKEVKCLHSFGYLSTLPKGNPLPEECFLCPKVVDCLTSSK